MRNIALAFWISVLSLCFASCGSDVFYEKIHTIDKESWNKNAGVTCSFDIEDTMQYYTIYMNIRNNVNYRYQNLYVFMDTKDPKGTVTRDTLEFVLADLHGNWKGKGNRLKDYQYFFYPKVRFPYKGKYTFTFYQAMREDNLDGIANFGMTVKYFDEEIFRKDMARRKKEAERAHDR